MPETPDAEKTMHCVPPATPLFVAFGNPLLDIVANFDEKEVDALVRKHNLLRDVGQEIDTSALMQDVRHKK